MAITHFDRDLLRALHRNPLAWEPIVLSNPRADDTRVDACTRARLEASPTPPPVPKDRQSVVSQWYADRAVPYPTLLETRDDSFFVTGEAAARHQRAVVSRLRALQRDAVTLARSYTLGRSGTQQSFDDYNASIGKFITFLNS